MWICKYESIWACRKSLTLKYWEILGKYQGFIAFNHIVKKIFTKKESCETLLKK
ncbi:hypothetical protein HMPREF3216_00357 [Gardnerella vaginalis]|uniref:Uncharacterized protein n=1 Tax=Gardnerella vaginalis TaxID=2702 RepID=A0A133NQ75_GARVA|nr:hypothetical protein HMPREF3216_00357 [Gardnerella vaginalis]